MLFPFPHSEAKISIETGKATWDKTLSLPHFDKKADFFSTQIVHSSLLQKKRIEVTNGVDYLLSGAWCRTTLDPDLRMFLAIFVFSQEGGFFSTQIDNPSFLLHQNKSRKMPQFLNKTSLFVGQSSLKDIGKSLVLQPHFSLPVLEGSYWEVGRLFGKRWWSNEEMIPWSKANPTGFCFECNPLEQH